MAREIEQLVEEARRGGQSAFQELVHLHMGAVLALTRSLLGDPAEGEDVAQETFMAAYQRLEQLREPRSFAAWLYKIARNRCRRQLETRLRRPRLFSLESDAAGEAMDSGAERGAGSGVADDQRGSVLEALDNLPEEYALVLRLRHIEDLGLEAIAGLCGLSVSGVNTRLYRGRKMLREKLVRSRS